MENTTFFIALFLIFWRLLFIFCFKKTEKNNKKDLAHYEAIADEHMRKIYNPVLEHINVIICLFLAGITLPLKFFIILYIMWCIFEAIFLKLKILQNAIDLLTVKQGLISMPFNFNPYTASNFPHIKVEIKNDRLFYIIDDRIIKTFCIDIENLSQDEIKQTVYWHEKKLKDYLMYIPKEVLLSDNIQAEFDRWFIYLDDVRANY